MLLYFIIACEVGFWVLLLAGLLTRYGFKRPFVGKLLLLCVPLVDVALLIATAADLRRGTPAEFAHGLAAVYLGFTVVYGHGIIQWMDQYVAYRFSMGKRPNKPVLFGWEHAVNEWRQWFKGGLACAIAAMLLLAAIAYVDEPQATQALVDWLWSMLWLLGLWLLGWPVWYSVFPKKAPTSASSS